MVAKAKAPGTSVAKAKLNLPANINAEMAAEVAELSSRLAAPSGDRIKLTKSGTFIMPDGVTYDNLEVIIVDFVSRSEYYDSPYVKGEVKPPACFAIGLEPKKLVPSANSPAPQNGTCAGCDMDAFGSADNGSGKACKNARLLAVIPPDADATTPLWLLSVPATSLKFFDAYANGVAQSFQKPLRAVVTTITGDDTIGWENVRFGEPRSCTDDQLLLAHSRRDEARKRLMTEPDVSAYEAPKARGKAAIRGKR